MLYLPETNNEVINNAKKYDSIKLPISRNIIDVEKETSYEVTEIGVLDRQKLYDTISNKISISISYGTEIFVDYTINTSEIYGKNIIITFENNSFEKVCNLSSTIDENNVHSSEYLGEFLHFAGLMYFAHYDVENRLLSEQNQVYDRSSISCSITDFEKDIFIGIGNYASISNTGYFGIDVVLIDRIIASLTKYSKNSPTSLGGRVCHVYYFFIDCQS